MSEFDWRAGETFEARLARLPGNMVRYAINLDKMADGKRNCYSEIINLCKMFDIDYDAGGWMTPFWVIPNGETNIHELEQFMEAVGIPFTKHAHLH